jgi:hypothetical protein
MFGIMLMLGGAGGCGVGTATACGSPLVIATTTRATIAEIILFFVLIIVSPLFVLFIFEASLPEVSPKEKTTALSQ